ncbi:MAG: formate dehydrogenase accessory sulfurtransferase FdhD [bacterium]|nr:formate dehydrogenase accessory sulfurtransferase FdhD [bacterium]
MNTDRFIIKFNAAGEYQQTMDAIAAEVLLRIYVNDDFLTELSCTPQDLRELVIGYLYVNGWANSQEQQGVPFDIYKMEDGVYTAKLNISLNREARGLTQIGAACQDGETDKRAVYVMSCMDALLHASKAFEETGCIHAAGLFRMYGEDETAEAVGQPEAVMKPQFLGEDISRYYALYKAVGSAVIAGADLSKFYLCTTGRLPVGYMERVIRTGIPCVISRSAPTDAALSLAEKYGVLVYGFANGKRVNLYPTLTGCAVLAGGMATRIGGVDKSRLTYQGKTFLSQIQGQLPVTMPQYLSYNRNPEDIRQYCERAVIVPDGIGQIGPLGGLEALLRRAGNDGCVRLLLVACDMPLYNRSITETLLQEADDHTDITVFRTGDGRVQTLCGMYRISCLPVIEQMIEEKCYKLQALLDRVRTRYLQTNPYQLSDEWFRNVNTPEDYPCEK